MLDNEAEKELLITKVKPRYTAETTTCWDSGLSAVKYLLTGSPKDPVLERIFDRLGGSLLTALAMVPQAILAYLLMHEVLSDSKEKAKEISIVSFNSIVAFSAFIGKDILVRSFNEMDFKNLAKFLKTSFTKEFWQAIFANKKQSLVNTISWTLQFILTLPPSLVFGGITIMSLEQIAELLSKYNSDVAHALAKGFISMESLVIFTAASIVCNLFGFKGIHYVSYLSLRDILAYPFNGDARLIEQVFSNKITDLLNAVKIKADAGEIEEAKGVIETVLQKLTAGNQGSSDANSLEQEQGIITVYTVDDFVKKFRAMEGKEKEEIILKFLSTIETLKQDAAYKDLFIKTLPPQSWLEFLTYNTTATLFVGATIYGFTNFLRMGALTYNIMSHWPTIGQLFSEENPIFKSIFSWMDMISMSRLAFVAVYSPFYKLTAALLSKIFPKVFYDRDSSINFTSRYTTVSVAILAITFAFLGGTPNAFQSLFSHQALYTIIFSLSASAFAEVYAMFKLGKDFFTDRVVKKDQDKAIIFEFQNFLTEVKGLYIGNEISENLQQHLITNEHDPVIKDKLESANKKTDDGNNNSMWKKTFNHVTSGKLLKQFSGLFDCSPRDDSKNIQVEEEVNKKSRFCCSFG